jgi:hypothetical protein
MTTLRYLMYVFLLAQMWRCSADTSDMDDTQPIFFLSGQWGGSVMDIKAGVGNYYLFTDYRPGGPADSNRLLLSGRFATVGCTNQCPVSVAFFFQNNQPGGQVDIQKLLSLQKMYPYTALISTADLTRVRIELQGPDGAVWRTDDGPQLLNARFGVTRVGPYKDNENKQATWQMTVDFDCLLYRNGEARALQGAGVIAVAYPR